MCGFCGFTGHVEEPGKVIQEMMDKIIHRGPDSAGVHKDDFATLGFRRLSIIDLADGSQPIYNEDKSIAVMLNGEIYNYQTLMDELKEKGHSFTTRSDTEVLVHLYEEKGTDMINDLRGMFAFVIYDIKKQSLLCVRDYFGIKPFYYARLDNDIIFGSEIKSFLPHPRFEKEVNKSALEAYLTFQYSVLTETFFKGVFRLPPAHYLLFEKGELEIKRYWEPKFQPESSVSLEETVNNIDDTIKDSIKMHKISDVEVGSFLSSGVDSSYVAACFNGDKTFTVGFDYEKYNEIDYAKSLSEKVKIDNYSKMITTEEYWDILPKVQYHMDEPLADPSAVALYFVSQLASGHVKVALSGEGADEFFGGYNIYKEPLDLKILTSLPMFLRRLLGRLAKALPFEIKGKNFFIRGSQTIEERFIGNAKIFNMDERRRILKEDSGGNAPDQLTKPLYDKVKDADDITKMQYLDIHLWMVGDILLKADKMSMAHSLEVRVPYLDKEVFRTASKIPTAFRVNKTDTKYAFRRAAARCLPQEVANKKKLGFPVPIRIWLKEDAYYKKVRTAFESPAAEKFFKTEEIIGLLDAHRQGKRDNSRKIWTIYMFLIWYEDYFSDAVGDYTKDRDTLNGSQTVDEVYDETLAVCNKYL